MKLDSFGEYRYGRTNGLAGSGVPKNNAVTGIQGRNSALVRRNSKDAKSVRVGMSKNIF